VVLLLQSPFVEIEFLRIQEGGVVLANVNDSRQVAVLLVGCVGEDVNIPLPFSFIVVLKACTISLALNPHMATITIASKDFSFKGTSLDDCLTEA
jgi:hypothetical protein